MKLSLKSGNLACFKMVSSAALIESVTSPQDNGYIPSAISSRQNDILGQLAQLRLVSNPIAYRTSREPSVLAHCHEV